MKKSSLLFMMFFICVAASYSEDIILEKKDYLKFLTSSYVHGFKSFDTTVVAFENSISVGIYYSESSMKIKAEELAERFNLQIPLILKSYKWAEGVTVKVSVCPETQPKP